MASTGVQKESKDYYILGPAVKPNNGVLEAIYSLQYLPQNYQLLLPANTDIDEIFHGEIITHIKRNALGNRVHFISTDMTDEAPEAYASAVLKMARTAV